MGFRYRKSIRIAKGLKLNVSKSGLSLSAGGRGATVNLGPRGVRGTVGIPGTGLSWSQTLTSMRSPSSGTSRMSIANKIEVYRSQGGCLAEFVNEMERLVGVSLDAIRSYGRENGYPVILDVNATELSPGQMKWRLNARRPPDPREAMEPGEFGTC